MEPVRLPVATDNTEDSHTESVVKLFSNHNHRGRARKPFAGVESLGCLSLLDEGERPRALPSPDVTAEHSTTYTKIHVQPIIQRPRAVLSSPDNDELICELQGQPDKRVNTAHDAPKAPLSPLEGPTSAGGQPDKREHIANDASKQPDKRTEIANDKPKAPLSPLEGPTSVGGEIFVDICSTERTDTVDDCPKPPLSALEGVVSVEGLASVSIAKSSHQKSSVLSSSQDHMDTSNSNISMSEPSKKEPAGHGMTWEHKSVSTKRDGNDENLSNANGRNRVMKRAGCSPSSAPNVGLKEQTHKPAAKGNSGRVIRPWY